MTGRAVDPEVPDERSARESRIDKAATRPAVAHGPSKARPPRLASAL
jgi:hypothetical protein